MRNLKCNSNGRGARVLKSDHGNVRYAQKMVDGLAAVQLR